MPRRIASLQNPRIKEIVKLNRRRQRDSRRATVVEGVREVTRALDAGVVPMEAFICPQLAQSAECQRAVSALTELASNNITQLFDIPPEVFAKLTYRGDSDGLLLVVPYLSRRLDDLSLKAKPLLAIVEAIEKPGNLGAILRTADAAGVDAVIVCRGVTDAHNPNVVRASLGTLFTVPVAEVDSAVALEWLHENSVALIAATPDAKVLYTNVDMTGPVAIATGSEAHGLSQSWLDAADVQVRIPMFGSVDSLNLATATALLLYEAVRQEGV